MCNLGDPLTAGELIERLRDVPPQTLIRLTSFSYHRELLTYNVHRADYPCRSADPDDDGEYVWLSFQPVPKKRKS